MLNRVRLYRASHTHKKNIWGTSHDKFVTSRHTNAHSDPRAAGFLTLNILNVCYLIKNKAQHIGEANLYDTGSTSTGHIDDLSGGVGNRLSTRLTAAGVQRLPRRVVIPRSFK